MNCFIRSFFVSLVSHPASRSSCSSLLSLVSLSLSLCPLHFDYLLKMCAQCTTSLAFISFRVFRSIEMCNGARATILQQLKWFENKCWWALCATLFSQFVYYLLRLCSLNSISYVVNGYDIVFIIRPLFHSNETWFSFMHFTFAVATWRSIICMCMCSMHMNTNQQHSHTYTWYYCHFILVTLQSPTFVKLV